MRCERCGRFLVYYDAMWVSSLDCERELVLCATCLDAWLEDRS